jgi:Fungal N-terminal domain of STAND proteins
MEVLGSAASVIAVIQLAQLAGSIIKTCGGYIGEVKNAEMDINRLQKAVEDFKVVVDKLSDLLGGPDGGKLLTSLELVSPISDCSSNLEALKEKLTSSRKKGKIIGLLELRALKRLKWPLESKEVKKVINNLEGYKKLFSLALQVDQTSVIYLALYSLRILMSGVEPLFST